MDVIRYPYESCLCIFWHCHPYFILQFYSLYLYYNNLTVLFIIIIIIIIMTCYITGCDSVVKRHTVTGYNYRLTIKLHMHLGAQVGAKTHMHSPWQRHYTVDMIFKVAGTGVGTTGARAPHHLARLSPRYRYFSKDNSYMKFHK